MFESLSSMSGLELFFIALIFVWTGFVRSGLGFGGAALGLPLMLFIDNQPLYWLPIIGCHLLFFTSITLRSRMNNVDWHYLGRTSLLILPAAIVGVFGLLNLPNHILVVFIYGIALLYAVLWFLDIAIQSNNKIVDNFLLFTGGYVAGTSLTGAPLMVAVFMRNVTADKLRNTLFVLWFVIVSIKMSTFVVMDVAIHLDIAALLLPVAAIGHFLGLKAHNYILNNDRHFRRAVGGALVVVSSLGLWKVFFLD